MLILRNGQLQLNMLDNGTDVILEDLTRGVRWLLIESTRLASSGERRLDSGAWTAGKLSDCPGMAGRIGPGTARALDATTLECRHPGPGGSLTLRWILEPDRLRVQATAAEGIHGLTLPGTWMPVSGEPWRAAVPLGQGVLHTGKGPAFYRPLQGHGHGFGCNMDMFGQLGPRGGLLVIAETESDAVLHWEKTEGGQVRLMWRQEPSFGQLAYTRETVIFAVPPDLTALCKQYRRYEIEHGRFKTWDQKIAERPALERLFGAAIVFIGYHQDDQLDYAASLRRLRAMGIDRALVYPVFTRSTMGEIAPGMRWVDIRAQVPLLHELGYTAGSFIYITDGSQDEPPQNLLHDANGKPIVAWQIHDMKWYAFSCARRFEWARQMLDQEHAGLDAIHYDVLCCGGVRENYNPAHRNDTRADIANRREMLDYAAAKGLIVSSEGFWGRMTPSYDLGSCKFAHVLGGEEYCVVPMTMLVYHDCAWHTWWEVDNYNNYEHRSQFARGQTQRLPWGGGHARLQAAIDACLGTPPDIFPFGLQYGFVPHSQPQTYSYRFRLEDVLVQEAIEYAKPVMALNRRVGKLELVEHKLHRLDGAVQESVFADGTRVVANFANVPLEAPEVGLLEPESWVVR